MLGGLPMPNKELTKNDKYMIQAKAAALHSKDTSTKVGAILIGPDGEGGPFGYNGAPRGCKADEDARFQTRPEKYHWAEHAERNVIYTAARRGFSTLGSTIVVTHFPCMDCARAIVQAGIKRVVTLQPDPDFEERWFAQIARAIRLFKECGVEVEVLPSPAAFTERAAGTAQGDGSQQLAQVGSEG